MDKNKMKLNEYQMLSKRTMPKGLNSSTISEFSMGLSGEAGEVVDLLKKFVYHHHELDIEKLTEELGDLLFYLNGLATMFNIYMDDVATTNIEKRLKRYPNGFTREDSIKRVDEK